MKTICVDPVTAALLTTRRPNTAQCREQPHSGDRHEFGLCCHPVPPPFLSFVTVDRPPPVGWIGQRVAIYAKPVPPAALRFHPARAVVSDDFVLAAQADAIVGSGTLAEALPIYVKGDCGWTTTTHICVWGPNDLAYYGEGIEARFISDQLPLQDWTPGRWALRFTDVAPTSERCPDCWGRGSHDVDGEGNFAADGIWSKGCPTCRRAGYCPAVVAPVLSGDDPTYKKWLSGQKENQHE